MSATPNYIDNCRRPAPRPATFGPSPQSENGGNWESQKRRLLAELESKDEQEEEAVDRRLKIEEIIARTDQIIADKDREIEELKHLLDCAKRHSGLAGPGAEALEHVFDKDDMIREERQRLEQCRTSCARNGGRPRSSTRWSGRGLPGGRLRSRSSSAAGAAACRGGCRR